MSLKGEQLWADNYDPQNTAVLESYPVASEIPPQLLPEQPVYCDGTFNLKED